MSQNLQNVAKFQKFQLENLVDFEKCCQTHIYLQNFVLIQPKTSDILPKFCQKLACTDPEDLLVVHDEAIFAKAAGLLFGCGLLGLVSAAAAGRPTLATIPVRARTQ